MKEKIKALIALLEELHDDIAEYDDVKDKNSRLNAMISVSEKQLAGLKKDLSGHRDLLEGQKAEAKKNYEKDIYAKQCELRDLVDHLTQAKAELATAQHDVVVAQRKQEQIVAATRKVEKTLA